jgi:MFS transporter, PPP family, 3-phenylpropionic acid transporter
MLARVVAIPLATRVADRRDALRTVIVAMTAAGVLGYAALALADGFVLILLGYAVASAAYTPVMMLVDAYALRGLARFGRAYGPVRLWGSAAFIAASFGAGTLIDLMSPRDLIWLIVAAMVVATVAAGALAPLGGGMPPAPAAAAPGRPLWRDGAFLAVVAAASLIQASHAVLYGFASIAWRAAGLDGTVIGILWALGVLAEIAVFALSPRLPAAVTPGLLLVIGAAGAVLRWTAMAFAPPGPVLPLLQGLHGLSFAATHLGALAFVARSAPPGLGATAQGYLVVGLGLTMAAATALAGVLFERYGAASYGAMALMAAGGGLLALSTEARRR